MYKLIGSLQSRTFRVLWMLEELGVDYELVSADPRSEDILAYNPSGKIPALLADGEVLLDSTAIMQFLADKHGKLTFTAGTIQRAQQDSWTQFALDDVEAPLWFKAKNSFILPKELRSKTAIDACRHEFDKAIDVFEKRLGDKTYVMGDSFTVPDIILGHCGGWAGKAKLEIASKPVTDYFSRVQARPAFVRTATIRDVS